MALSWVLFDLNGTLVDPSVLAQPLGDSAADDEVVLESLDEANMQAMVATLTGERPAFAELLEASLRRRLGLSGGDRHERRQQDAAEYGDPAASCEHQTTNPCRTVFSVMTRGSTKCSR